MSTATPKLFCPIRGELTVAPRAKDGLTFTEEKRRIDCINFLLKSAVPAENIRAEKTLIILGHVGHKGRTPVRVDIAVYDVPVPQMIALSLEEQREHILLVAEIKRDSKDAQSGKVHQLMPALRILPDMRAVGVYWDDVEQRLFYKKMVDTTVKVVEAPIAYLPALGTPVAKDVLRYQDLAPSSDLVSLFSKIEDSLHVYRACTSSKSLGQKSAKNKGDSYPPRSHAPRPADCICASSVRSAV